MSDMDCLRSFTAIREKLYFDRKLISNKPLNAIMQKPASKTAKIISSDTEYKKDMDVIIGLHNDMKFINVIGNCRQNSSPLTYIFVESSTYITCVIKNPGGYPLVLIRSPINGITAFSNKNSGDVYYTFPSEILTNKNAKSNKHSNYTIIFKNEDNNVKFLYELNSGNGVPNTTTLNSIDVTNMNSLDKIFEIIKPIRLIKNKTSRMLKESVLPNDNLTPFDVFADPNDIQNQAYSQQQINNYITDSALLRFYNMNVLVLKQVKDNEYSTVIPQPGKQNSLSFIKISKNKMHNISESVSGSTDLFVCDSDESLIWNFDENAELKYEMVNFDAMFKQNFSNAIQSSDHVYYMFTSYMGKYFFIRMITAYDVKESITDYFRSSRSFAELFPRDYQIIECYGCILVDEA